MPRRSKWYRKAADQGDAAAQSNLGVMYANGQGVPQDYAEAVQWYRKAADQGDADAQNNLGVMYDKGQGVPQDYAAGGERGSARPPTRATPHAQFNLGVHVRQGPGRPAGRRAGIQMAHPRHFGCRERELRSSIATA